jgi:hypothetical protein
VSGPAATKVFEEPPSELDSMKKEMRAILDILK